jgi:hypothetical protein
MKTVFIGVIPCRTICVDITEDLLVIMRGGFARIRGNVFRTIIAAFDTGENGFRIVAKRNP